MESSPSNKPTWESCGSSTLKHVKLNIEPVDVHYKPGSRHRDEQDGRRAMSARVRGSANPGIRSHNLLLNGRTSPLSQDWPAVPEFDTQPGPVEVPQQRQAGVPKKSRVVEYVQRCHLRRHKS